MKKLFLAGVSAVAVVAGGAYAADLSPRMPVKAAPIAAPVPAFSWTGCYIGGHVGGGWGHNDWADRDPGSGSGTQAFFFIGGGDNGPKQIREEISGFLGGGQIGCNYQAWPDWVVGLEGSVSGTDIKGDAKNPFFGDKKVFSKTDWLASLTGRVGVTWQQWLFYGKGGVAWAGMKYSATDFEDLPEGQFNASGTRVGFTFGTGIEWAFLPNLSAFVEYDFYDFGKDHFNFTSGFSGFNPNADISTQIHTLRVGLNLRFWGGGGAPFGKGVVARY